MVEGSGFRGRVEGVRRKVQDSGFRVQGGGCWPVVESLGFRVPLSAYTIAP